MRYELKIDEHLIRYKHFNVKNGDNINFGHGLDKVFSEDFALISEDGTLNRYEGEQRCQLYKVGEPLIKVYQAIGLQKSNKSRKWVKFNNFCHIRFSLHRPDK